MSGDDGLSFAVDGSSLDTDAARRSGARRFLGGRIPDTGYSLTSNRDDVNIRTPVTLRFAGRPAGATP